MARDMKQYRFTALAKDGSLSRGVARAATVEDLIRSLYDNGLICVKYTAVKNRNSPVAKRLPAPSLIFLCQKMSALLNSGITLSEALRTVYRLRGGYERKIYMRADETLQSGGTLSSAMRELSPAFPDVLINMVRAGEEENCLSGAFGRMAIYFSRQRQMTSQVTTALTYPALLLASSVIVTVVMFTGFVPVITGMFGAADLPMITRVCIAISSFLLRYWTTALFILAAAAAALFFAFRFSGVRYAASRLKVRLPLVGSIYKKLYAARFSRSFGALYISGAPLLRSLELSLFSLDNAHYAECYGKAAARLYEGLPLSAALDLPDFMPDDFISTLVVGEASSNLGEALENIAEMYENEMAEETRRFVKMLEPVMILIMAAVIMFIILSVIIPIYNI